MDAARADALAARDRLARGGWIARDAESFRHLPPPPAAVWLGDGPEAPGCEAHPLAGAGWTLHPVGRTPQGRVDARWLDAADAAQRAELFAGLPQPDDDDAAPFAWAHRALCRQGLRLRIGDEPGAGRSAGETVWLQLRHQPRSAVEAPLLVIDVQAGVHCVLVETHERAPLQCARSVVQNLQAHVHLGEGATLQHLRIARPGCSDRLAHHLSVRLARGAQYHQALIAAGSAYHLQRNVVDLTAERSAARLAGVLFAAGSTIEQQLRVSHRAPHTASSIEGLALAGGAARAVLDAHTGIAEGCDEADVRQRLAGIPTGGQPKLVLRPHLEILHDRVQAAHGATWGALPDEALFYVRQRGLDEARARALIIEGMAAAVLARGLGGPELLETLGVDALLCAAASGHLAPAAQTCYG
ncbi:MAG: SufD family Fe-S cluster assembly protein [Burkholderiaceae bacterium]|nr:SufD family Fe-S cluster assembly protein [Burkholderiaceae bacterium]